MSELLRAAICEGQPTCMRMSSGRTKMTQHVNDSLIMRLRVCTPIRRPFCRVIRRARKVSSRLVTSLPGQYELVAAIH